ncbi:MAG TPA: hypothetical protein DDW21_03235 [Verrucomicrobiales bacterium]|nr:hypothetical protein [Verrucomicrobiales bacterium]
MKLANTTIPRDEYLQGEIVSEMRHEYIAGHVYVMSGGTLNHQRIAGNFFRRLKDNSPEKPAFPRAVILNYKLISVRTMRRFIIPMA